MYITKQNIYIGGPQIGVPHGTPQIIQAISPF